jgi:hypothetical protein
MSTTATGTNNVAIGVSALAANTTGSQNVAVGYQAGKLLTTGSQNIDIGSTGVADDANVIRIGQPGVHVATYIPSINNTDLTASVTAYPVFVDADGHLGYSTGFGGGTPNNPMVPTGTVTTNGPCAVSDLQGIWTVYINAQSSARIGAFNPSPVFLSDVCTIGFNADGSVYNFQCTNLSFNNNQHGSGAPIASVAPNSCDFTWLQQESIAGAPSGNPRSMYFSLDASRNVMVGVVTNQLAVQVAAPDFSGALHGIRKP